MALRPLKARRALRKRSPALGREAWLETARQALIAEGTAGVEINKLAKRLARQGIPVAYYVSPQLWATRPWRLKTMREIATRVLVIFPFEEAIYRDAHVPVEFVARREASNASQASH